MLLTPESSVLAQKQLGADIIIPLDELPPYHTEPAVLAASLARSHRWMARSLHTHLSDIRQQVMYAGVVGCLLLHTWMDAQQSCAVGMLATCCGLWRRSCQLPVGCS